MGIWSRRRFLGASAAGISAALAGCKTAPPPDQLGAVCHDAKATATSGIIVDVHSHIFNATDLQVERFITQVAKYQFPPALSAVIEALAPVLQRAGWEWAPDGDTELNRLAEVADKARKLDRSAFGLRDEVTRDRDEGRARFETRFPQALATPDGARFLRAYEEYRREVERSAPLRFRSEAVFQLDVQDLRTPEGLRSFLEGERRFPGKRIFAFAANFFQYRYVNALYLLENYGCNNGKVGLFACHMVDFDYGLGAGKNGTPTSLDKQIEVMARIHVLSGRRILPFVPYDPWRDCEEKGAALQRVTDAISGGKAIGVKLYPPMGFAPAGNANISPKPAPWPKDPAFASCLDRSMKLLFDWCETHGAPILAHAGKSNAPDKSFLNMGDPSHWNLAVALRPNLHVCFGHFGGDCLLSHDDECSGWAEGFVDIFKTAPNAYADWSYFEHVLPDDDRDALTQRAIDLFSSVAPVARDRIAYGSDWLMLAIEPSSEFYYRDFSELEGKLEARFPGISERFFVKNGAAYLNLQRGGATRARIEERSSKEGIRPSWLDAQELQ